LSLGAGPLVGYRSLKPPAHDEVVETSECQKPDENDELEEKRAPIAGVESAFTAAPVVRLNAAVLGMWAQHSARR
jgi:hypothetical protein